MAIALAFLSVSAKAQQTIDIDQLLQTSGSIVDTFSDGVAYVGGVTVATSVGQVVETGSASGAHLTYGQADAYNSALQATATATYSMTVQDYVDGARQEAQQDFSNAVDTYIASSGVLIQTITVNDMAETAAETQDATKAQEIQSYIATNDLTIQTVHVDVYNDSLDAVEEAGQEFAAFVAVANNSELMSQMESEVAAAGEDFLNADSLLFIAAAEGPTVVTLFSTSSSFITFDLGMGYIDSAQIYSDGVNSEFFQTSPFSEDDCFFTPMGCEQHDGDELDSPTPR